MDLLFMKPVFKDYLWGGNRLKNELNKNSTFSITAESWEISSNKNGDCKIKNTEYKGMTLSELFNKIETRKEIFGAKCVDKDEFPLLIKYIDANQNLSIQVHPNDEYANKIGLSGKNELWYIMDCEENSQIIAGLNKVVSKDELKDIIENNKIKEYIRYADVKKGDSIYIPAGTVHAILGGILICEIQQNSDVTFRVYDWDRRDKNGNYRELHKKQAIETISSKLIPEIIHKNQDEIQILSNNDFFEVKKIETNNTFKDRSNLDTCYLINIVDGNGSIKTTNKKYEIKKGDSFLIPASLGEYEFEGKMTILETFCK